MSMYATGYIYVWSGGCLCVQMVVSEGAKARGDDALAIDADTSSCT